MLEANHRKVRDDTEGLSFLTPEAWARELGVQPSYREMVFDRGLRTPNAVQRVLGVGHKVIDQALADARARSACAALLSPGTLARPLCLFLVTDRVTSSGGNVRSVAVGVEGSPGNGLSLLGDAALVQRLNDLLADRTLRRAQPVPSDADRAGARGLLEEAIGVVQRELPRLDLPFRVPEVSPLAILCAPTG
jgi:hypothetical protein